MSSQTGTPGATICPPSSKIAKNTLRLALNMHILYHAKTKNPPTPQLISDMTLQMAMSLNGLGDSEGDFTGGEFCTGGKPNRGLDLSCTFQVEVAVDIQPCGKV